LTLQAVTFGIPVAEYWSGIDAEDEADPWHGEPDEEQAGAR
jgi:hypothetical protein